MNENEILNRCLETLEGAVLVNSWGEQGLFYNPERLLKRGVYILTVKNKDGENDKGSRLDRDGIYPLNLGVRKKTYEKYFGCLPKRPAKGKTADTGYDYTETDKIIPHPVYAWMGWICVLNPSEKTFEELKPLISEAYEYAKEKYSKRKR